MDQTRSCGDKVSLAHSVGGQGEVLADLELPSFALTIKQ